MAFLGHRLTNGRRIWDFIHFSDMTELGSEDVAIYRRLVEHLRGRDKDFFRGAKHPTATRVPDPGQALRHWASFTIRKSH